MFYAAGNLLTTEGFQLGYISYNQTGILDIQLGQPPKKPDITGVLTPLFVNSHTHIGDTFIRDKIKKIPHSLEKVVAPPDGLKHQYLRTASTIEIIKGMQRSSEEMINSHTEVFCDFREGGIHGLSLLQEAVKKPSIIPIVLGRPSTMVHDDQEIRYILQKSSGIGISGISDYEYSILQKIAEMTHKSHKIFALHASEAKRENIDLILDLKPSFLIHMTQATEQDLMQVAEADIPIVLCPRSNHYFQLQPPYELLKKTKVPLLLGTDNAMITSPNILKEVQFIKKQTTLFTDQDLLQMITYLPRKALNLDDHIPALNRPRSYVVLKPHSLEPIQKI